MVNLLQKKDYRYQRFRTHPRPANIAKSGDFLNMTTDKDILKTIGEKLWSIMPTEAATIKFQGQFFPSDGGYSVGWFDRTNKWLGPIGLDHPSKPVQAEVFGLGYALQKTEKFRNEPFTHMEYVLDSDSKMLTKFAYIPEWDSAASLFMKGVSSLTSEDAAKFGPDALTDAKARFAREPYN